MDMKGERVRGRERARLPMPMVEKAGLVELQIVEHRAKNLPAQIPGATAHEQRRGENAAHRAGAEHGGGRQHFPEEHQQHHLPDEGRAALDNGFDDLVAVARDLGELFTVIMPTIRPPRASFSGSGTVTWPNHFLTCRNMLRNKHAIKPQTMPMTPKQSNSVGRGRAK